MPAHSRKFKPGEQFAGYALIAPSVMALALFLVLPIFLIFWLSFHEWNLLGPIEFVGLKN